MAQRTVCLYEGECIGIETIYTIVNGRQINIPDKLEKLREKSQNNELFCPCGCGSNLILVAGERNEQHFRLKDTAYINKCHIVMEGTISIASKIVLKCWLDEKLKTKDIETRVPINLIGDTYKKYEFSFLSRDKSIALNYCYDRLNLSDEKFRIIEDNRQGINIIHVIDENNNVCNGQYPERLMKVQNRQGYCLFLSVNNALYNDALMYAVFYAQDINGFWKANKISEGHMYDYTIDDNGQVIYKGKSLILLKDQIMNILKNEIQNKKIQREYAEKKRKQELEDERKREAARLAEIKRREEDFKRNMEENFLQQETPVKDVEGNRWLKCEICGKIGKSTEFLKYGGNTVNLGICRGCYLITNKKDKISAQKEIIYETKINPEQSKKFNSICPVCGSDLVEKKGKYGYYIGCSNYRKCNYSRKK